VIRDGTVVKHLDGDATPEAVARALVTDEADHLLETRSAGSVAPEVFVRLEDWRSRAGTFRIPGVELRRGEVVAVVGVEASGGREFVASLAGRERVRGRALTASGADAHGLLGDSAYLPASRQDSLFDNLSLAENAAVRLGRAKIATRFGLIRAGAIRKLGEAVREDFRVTSRSASQPIRSLSGGNQQKIAIAATLAPAPRVVAVEEPTRGVDVGSRAEIHRVLRAYAATGCLVAVFCTEVSEAFQIADRVFVMDRGRLSPAVEVGGHQNAGALAAALAALERHASGADDLAAGVETGEASRALGRWSGLRRRRP
jgi:ABC-type sugar transport system ATPase subunit